MSDVWFRLNSFSKLQWESVGMVVMSRDPVSKSVPYSGCCCVWVLTDAILGLAQWSLFHGQGTGTFSSSWTSEKMVWVYCYSCG